MSGAAPRGADAGALAQRGAPHASGNDVRRVMVFCIAGWSGFFVMGVELLSGRILAPSFGSGIYVWGGIITVFMLALSLGYLLGGRLSLRRPTLRTLGILLIVAAATTLPAALLALPLLDWLFDIFHDPRYGSLVSATLLFFAPTTVCGMVSPYAVRLLVTEHRQSGQVAGLLYFVSTLGSAAGTLLTSFYLVLWFDIGAILWGMTAVSLVLGIGGALVPPRGA